MKWYDFIIKRPKPKRHFVSIMSDASLCLCYWFVCDYECDEEWHLGDQELSSKEIEMRLLDGHGTIVKYWTYLSFRTAPPFFANIDCVAQAGGHGATELTSDELAELASGKKWKAQLNRQAYLGGSHAS